MVWETPTSLAAWFQEGQCQLYLDNLHFFLGLFAPSSRHWGGISFLKPPASRSRPRSNSASAAPTLNEMVTLSRVPNLLPPRPSQDDGTLAKANSLKLLYFYITILLYYSITILRQYYINILLYYYITILLYYNITVLMINVLLYFYITILLYHSITILL